MILPFFFLQYNDLLRKKIIVENDKAKIAELIKELDQKKNEALEKAHERVNKVSETPYTIDIVF